MKNFPVKVDGKEYWISRSVAAVVFVFKEMKNGMYVLLEKRGKGAADNVGKYCTICGYLDYNECIEDTCYRESMEECGFKIDVNKLKMMKVNSSPSEEHQNVSVHYIYKADENEDFNLKDAHGGEKDEVESVEWVKVGTFKDGKLRIDPYKIIEMDWAFNHDRRMLEYLSLEYDIEYDGKE